MRLTVEGAATRLEGPLLFLRRTLDVGLYDAVEVAGPDGHARLGRVAALDEELMTIEVLESTSGLTLPGTVVRFFGEPLTFGLAPGMLGRVFNGVGQVIDGGPPIAAKQRQRIEGLPINPVARAGPRDFIETGVSTLDLMNSLVRGQKLPIFSGGGLPHDRLAVEIASHARLRPAPGRAADGTDGADGADDFVIVFAGIGVPHDSAEFFRRSLEQGGALERTALFLNLASDSSTQRLLTPRFALTAAEYLAFVEGKHVLAILTDMTNYAEALREVSSSKGEIPSRKGFPGYLYSDLATLFERAGTLRGVPGTLTQLSILTMPADDIGHPIPDLTGYITEGQIVLSRDLDRRAVYPPVEVLPSLSRLMKDGIGGNYTHPDHPALSSQLYAAYARAVQARVLASVVGEEGLAATDRQYLSFGALFEGELVNQSAPRSLEQSMAIGWRLLAGLPLAELSRLSDAQIAAHLGPK
ncbi:MAG TPA: V-type ATP synthase subunit B [Rubrivivax sp.]|nr:V-type ATP synthase subunit B [Betaproteobacteria bacterium]MBP6316839.1 V-type ATP synthase subunit B [Rubrivivax sp.]MBK7459213.1 V-type ATP synthase subunit B [Betaproteobacteria bacterium]MBK9681840.1 V-type ATP synthase subunit B [Betaproteobacteria bacterium]MBP6463213.1 V-type ATP synthase subunit B [Rubrivivax sp.]